MSRSQLRISILFFRTISTITDMTSLLPSWRTNCCSLSPGQTIATCQRNTSQHCWAQHVARVWPPCCDALRHVGCCWPKFEDGQIWASYSQHVSTAVLVDPSYIFTSLDRIHLTSQIHQIRHDNSSRVVRLIFCRQRIPLTKLERCSCPN